MTIYAGQTVRTKVTATDFDGVAIAGPDVTSAIVEFFDTSATPNTEVLDGVLTWDATKLYWYFDWQNVPAGTFKVKATFVGVAFQTWAYTTLRVKPDLEVT